jgi:hypothetical protein
VYTEAGTVLRTVALDIFFNCWYLEIASDNRIRETVSLVLFKPSGTTRNKAIAKELANRSAYQIQYVIVNIVFKV